MDSFSENFKTWMDGKGFTSETLAPVLGKSPGTIANWRSIGVPVRSSVRDFLINFMDEYQRPLPQAEETRIAVPFTDKEYALVEKAARLSDVGTPIFVRIAAIKRAQEKIAEDREKNPSPDTQSGIHLYDKVAVEETPYRTSNGEK